MTGHEGITMTHELVPRSTFEAEIRRLDGRIDAQTALYLRDMAKLDQTLASMDSKFDQVISDRERDRGRWAVITYIVTAAVGILSAVVVALILRGAGV